MSSRSKQLKTTLVVLVILTIAVLGVAIVIQHT